MAGIIFLKTRQLDAVRRFYIERIGMSIWLEQADCIILRHGNLLLGFCARPEADTGGIVTFYYPGRGEVDRMHARLADVALGAPAVNEKYRIYHFFLRDPEGRQVECQHFLHPVEPV